MWWMLAIHGEYENSLCILCRILKHIDAVTLICFKEPVSCFGDCLHPEIITISGTMSFLWKEIFLLNYVTWVCQGQDETRLINGKLFTQRKPLVFSSFV